MNLADDITCLKYNLRTLSRNLLLSALPDVKVSLKNLLFFTITFALICVFRKRMKALDNLVALIQNCPLDDPQSVKLQDDTEKLRAKFRQVSSLLSLAA